MRLSNGEVLLRWPLDQHILTQGWHYNSGRSHNGIDLRTQIGNTAVRPVYAAEDGTVSATQLWDGHTTDERSMQSYGNYVDIRHADYRQQSLVTRYAHLFKFIVAKGEKVKEGQLIGYSGATGNVFGAHLHFEVLLGGKRTNPLTWLDDDFTTASSSVYSKPRTKAEPYLGRNEKLKKLVLSMLTNRSFHDIDEASFQKFLRTRKRARRPPCTFAIGDREISLRSSGPHCHPAPAGRWCRFSAR